MIKLKEIIKIANQVCKENDLNFEISENSSFIGGESSLDSMGLVQLCIALEEKANEMNFDFDWTSEKAMSSMNSIFRSPKTICDEFNRQLIMSNK